MENINALTVEGIFFSGVNDVSADGSTVVGNSFLSIIGSSGISGQMSQVYGA